MSDSNTGGIVHPSDPYLVINTGLAQLNDNAADVDAAWAVCQAYVRLGLFGPARELLSNPEGAHCKREECQDLAAQIAGKPSGRIAWGALQQRFEKNLARLYESKPDIRRHDAELRSLPQSCELYRTGDGAILLSTRGEHGRRWLPDALSAVALAAGLKPAHADADSFCGNYILSGDRFLALLERLFSATSKMLLGFAPRIFVVEPDVRMLAAGLYVRERIEPLLHARTLIFADEPCLEEFAAFLDAHPEVNPPSYQVHPPNMCPGFQERLDDAIKGVVERRQAHTRAAIATATRLYVDTRPARRGADAMKRRIMIPCESWGLPADSPRCCNTRCVISRRPLSARGSAFTR